MKQQYAVFVLFALIIGSCLTGFGSFKSASRLISEDMDRALALTMQEQQSDVICQDTIRMFNSHLRMAELRGRVTLAVDARGTRFKAYAHCSEAMVFSLSDQRPMAFLWMLTIVWAAFCIYLHRRDEGVLTPGLEYGGLCYHEAEGSFCDLHGAPVRLTPMQHQLLEMFFRSPSHSLTKAEICDALWPKKPDASETLYTLIRRLKPVIEQHSNLFVESDRSKAYHLKMK